ncbi:MAG: hypothetical protein C4344_05160 [Acidimicrobiia bacterium]
MAGSTVRGDVTITEDRGAQKPFYCPDSGVSSTITVVRRSDGAVVHQGTKDGAGGFSTTWVTHGQPIGDYNLKSVAVDKDWLCRSQAPKVLSDIDVRLENLSSVAYTGDTAAPMLGSFTAAAQLKDATTDRPIADRAVWFHLDGVPVATCTTDATGTCSTRAVALALPGGHTMTVSFAGDCCWIGSSLDARFTVISPVPLGNLP